MPGTDRNRGILTKDDRDYLNGKKKLTGNSERNARNRIRNRIRNSLYDYEYLQRDLESRDVKTLVTTDGEVAEDQFEALEDIVAFVFRMCTHAPATTGYDPVDRFREIVHNGLEKSLPGNKELLDFQLDVRYGLPKEAKAEIQRKLKEGEDLSVADLREALNNGYLDDSFKFRPLDQNGLPKNVDPEDIRSHDDYPGYH